MSQTIKRLPWSKTFFIKTSNKHSCKTRSATSGNYDTNCSRLEIHSQSGPLCTQWKQT